MNDEMIIKIVKEVTDYAITKVNNACELMTVSMSMLTSLSVLSLKNHHREVPNNLDEVLEIMLNVNAEYVKIIKQECEDLKNG